MTPAFGFSVGDFISAISLVKRVTKALKETGGASTDYQLVVIELKGLKNLLRHLERLQPTEDNATYINAIRGMALASQLPLRDFMVKLERYESTLGPFADKRSLRAMARKSKWAVVFVEEVERLRAMIAAKNISLNLLLAVNISKTISQMGSRDEDKHSDLMSKAAEHRAALQKVQDGVKQVEEKVSRAGAAFERLDSIHNTISWAGEASKRRFDEIDTKVEHTQISVMSLRSTGEFCLRRLGTFPREMRELLENILRANWQMYQILLKIQQSTVRPPTGLLESNPFEGFIRAQFKDKPGERKVIEGQYYIIDVGNGRTVVEKERWDRSIQQGATLTMSLVMSHLRRRASSCPRPSCPGGGFNQCPGPGLLSCKTCNLKFYPIWDKLENSSNRLEEEDQVAQRQNEEELRLYGSRPEPMDALEVDVDTQLVDLLTNDLTMDFKTALDEAENAHKETASNSDDENEDEANIYVDGNAGANPLSAWLTHSALPSVVPMQSHPLDQSIGTYFDLVEQEKKEIVVFRSVHLISNPESDGHVTEITEDKSVLDLELSLQIYYRNIVDRYPLLPTYLARRLAEANSIRAERLSHQRVEAAAKGKSTHAKLHGSNASGTTKCPDAGSVSEGTGQKAERNFEKVRCDLCTEVKTFSRRDALTRHKRVVHPDVNFPVTTRGGLEVEERVDETPKSVRKRASPYTSLSKGQPQSDYWSGETRHYRTESVGSHSSSMNSSLHGSPKFCYQKEYQNTDYFTSKSKYFYSSPSLAPPPVKLRKGRPSKRKAKKKSFRCDICGERVKVDGRHQRRQWQKHVMKDLRPYNCTALECDHTTESFPSLFRLLTHEIETHGLSPLERPSASTFSRRTQESISCIFYGERTENDRRRHLVHVGHHMEEIAFTVVAKANEEWEFYSESSFANSDSCKQTKAAVPKRNAAAADTDEK